MKKILVIDDEKYISRLLHFNLSEDGYRVISASRGKEGLDLAKKYSPDLIILDIAMPEMDGFAVYDKLKEDTRTNSIPILILTAKVMEEIEKRCKEKGVDGFITKPFSPAELTERIKSLIG